MKTTILSLAMLVSVLAGHAQTAVDTVLIQHDTDTPRTGKRYHVTLGPTGMKVTKSHVDTILIVDVTKNEDSIYEYKITDNGEKVEKVFEVHYGMLDLGFNRIHAKPMTTGPTAAQIAFLGFDPTRVDHAGTPGLLPLREGKSINVNIWPVSSKLRLYNSRLQRLYLTTGIGLQLYNFRWKSSSNYTDQPTVRLQNFDSLDLVKNKLAFTYLSVPLMLQSKTRLSSDAQMVIGFGAIGGYRLSSWTKFKRDDGDKIKNFDDFNFRDFKVALTGEVGIDPYLRLYATYDLTRLHNDDGTGLDQHPWTIGVRLAGL